MIRERSKEKFNIIKEECVKALASKDMPVLKRFLDSAQMYCFCFIPKALYGFMPNTSMNEKLHDLIKGIIPYSKPFTVVAKKVLIYLE